MKKSKLTRTLFFLLGDILLLSSSVVLSFLFRFDFSLPPTFVDEFWIIIPTFVSLKVVILYAHGLYRISWTYISVQELAALFRAVLISTLLLGSLLFLLRFQPYFEGFPRSILFIDFLLSLVLIGGFRSAKRVYLQFFRNLPLEGKRTLIVGAGDAGEQIIRSIKKTGEGGFNPVGFVDDDPQKIGTSIHGVEVLGTRKEIPQLVDGDGIDALLIAMPSVSSRVIKGTVELARKAGIEDIKILPDISELMTGEVGLSDARDVQLEDLLGRESIDLEPEQLEGFLEGRRVLVTGAAGTIGSELCRQIARFAPQELGLIDHEETALFEVKNELERSFPKVDVVDFLADVRDERRMREIFSENSPQLVFHAAAYKHVGMMEKHPQQAVDVNVFGTKSVARAAVEAGVERFVLISTDKAVEPTSTMGASKRMAEAVIQDYAAGENAGTVFTAVRFGNVLGSRGSVVKIFQRQIENRGPVTVTDPEAARYFMIPSEAVLLVLQAARMAEGGEVFVLDMGKPVKILDLAKEMIRLAGYEPDEDIPISFIGLKDGEKLSEDLLHAEEGTTATGHEKIFKAVGPPVLANQELKKSLTKLEQLAENGSGDNIKRYLSEVFPSYELNAKGARSSFADPRGKD